MTRWSCGLGLVLAQFARPRREVQEQEQDQDLHGVVLQMSCALHFVVLKEYL